MKSFICRLRWRFLAFRLRRAMARYDKLRREIFD